MNMTKYDQKNSQNKKQDAAVTPHSVFSKSKCRRVGRSLAVLLLAGMLMMAFASCGITRESETVEGRLSSITAEEPVDPRSPEEKLADETLADMSLSEKIAQLFIVTPESLTGYSTVVQFGDASKEALDQYPIGGLIYFDQNLTSRAQTTEMLSSTAAYAKESEKIPPFLAVDEEGGVVARCANNLHTTAFSGFSAASTLVQAAQWITVSG